MFSLIPSHFFSDPTKKWLDTGCGCGYFSKVLYYKLNEGLSLTMPETLERHNHIIENMMYMIDIQPKNTTILKSIFGEKANIINQDYLKYKNHCLFDFIIGNPPFNCNGIKKVPTNNIKNKKKDGVTIWRDFLIKSLLLLNKNGFLLYIVPSIWMKPDRAKIHNLLLKYKIHHLHCFTNTQTNGIFNGYAQTPTCFFSLENTPSDNKIQLYDCCYKKYINYNVTEGCAIPVHSQYVVNKLQGYVYSAGSLKVIKASSPPIRAELSDTSGVLHPYKNVKTCVLTGFTPRLVYQYSNIPLAYHKTPKIILAHKMYGFPYMDEKGCLGISNRENYVVVDYTIPELKNIRDFLSTKLALYVFEATRYRMKYLERYAFQLLPDITKLPNFPKVINDNSVANYFHLSEKDLDIIKNFHRNYLCYKIE